VHQEGRKLSEAANHGERAAELERLSMLRAGFASVVLSGERVAMESNRYRKKSGFRKTRKEFRPF
jgi:hypothetical protein